MARKTPTPPEPEMPLRLAWMTPDELSDNPGNWRRHPTEQVSALNAAMETVGWAGAALYNASTGRLVDGHCRKKIRPELLVDGKMPVLIGNWTEEQERMILLTLDPLAGMAEADSAALESLIKDVRIADEALAAMVEGLAEDAGLVLPPEDTTPADAEPQVDRAAALQEQWGTCAGQLWLLGGKHRLLIGDCRNPDDMARLCGADKINVAFTSPPYASQRKYDESSGFKPIPPDEYVAWWEPVQANIRQHLADDGSFFVNIKPHCEDGERVLYVFDLVLRMRRGWGWRFVDEFCWRDTKNGVPGGWNNRFKDAFEPVYHFSQGSTKFNPDAVSSVSDGCFDYSAETAKGSNGSGLKSGEPAGGMKRGLARPSNVIDMPAADGQDGHSAAFPIGLPSFFIRAFSDPGDVILDPFMGSGTTCIAAENHGRRSLGCEISAKYAGVILQRYADAFPDQEIRQAE